MEILKINFQEQAKMVRLSRIGESFASFRDGIKSEKLPTNPDKVKERVASLASEFEQIALGWFKTELGHFKEPGQTTIGSRYKNASVEYSRTLNSILSVAILTPASLEDLAKDANDTRYQLFTHLQTKNKLSVENFKEIQKLMFEACPDNKHLGLLEIILTSHDLGKLGTVAAKISKVAGFASVSHDFLLGQMTRIPTLYNEIIPAFGQLPDSFKSKAKKIMDSGFNRGQHAQAESTPLQVRALNPDLVTDNDVAMIRAESTADLSGVTGDLGRIYNEDAHFVYKTSDEAVDIFRSGSSEKVSYLYILNQRLKRAGVRNLLRSSDFDTSSGKERIAIARVATLIQADDKMYKGINEAYKRLGSGVKSQLVDSLTRTGLDSKVAYMFYYHPALYEITIKNEKKNDPENGFAFGIEKAMRLNAHLGLLADQFLREGGIKTGNPILLEKTKAGVKNVSFSDIGLRGFQAQVDEFVFGLDRIVRMLQNNYKAFSIPENPNEAFIDYVD